MCFLWKRDEKRREVCLRSHSRRFQVFCIKPKRGKIPTSLMICATGTTFAVSQSLSQVLHPSPRGKQLVRVAILEL